MNICCLGSHKGAGIRYAMHLSAPNGGLAQMLQNPEGNWVPYEDYARLKAEVERLRKAGDAMATLIVDELAFYEDDGSQYEEVKCWNAAKEVQS